MKLFVTGVAGQLGYDVMNEIVKRGYEAFVSDKEENYSLLQDENESHLTYIRLDITDEIATKKVINTIKPDVVIHCAAWTAVDLAEDEKNYEQVYRINVTGTENVAKICKQIDCKMIYISTDYVFDGRGTRPWQPNDERNPLNYYGQTKLEGELAVETLLKKYFILRISWAFGMNGTNFVKTMLNLGKTQKKLSVVSDQIGSPTYTPDLARLIVDMSETDKYGKYHATNEGFCSWYEFACEIFCKASNYNLIYDGVVIEPIDSNSYPSKAKRPYNSRMSKDKLIENGFARLPVWQNALERYIKKLELQKWDK